MGRTHAATGVLAGLLLGPAIGLHGLAEVGPFAATCAGYALLPDLDHPSSTVTRKLGPITRAASAGLRAASATLYRATKGPRDEQCGTHRHATHTILFASLAGALCWATTAAWGSWAVLIWLAFGLLLAYDRLGKLMLVPFGIAAASWIPQVGGRLAGFGPAALAALEQSAGWLGIAVAAGCVVHCLGDAITESGCPFLFPIPIAGETWFEIRPPRWLRFHTGKRVENWLIFPLVVLACIAAVPGVWPHLIDVLHSPDAVTAGALR